MINKPIHWFTVEPSCCDIILNYQLNIIIWYLSLDFWQNRLRYFLFLLPMNLILLLDSFLWHGWHNDFYNNFFCTAPLNCRLSGILLQIPSIELGQRNKKSRFSDGWQKFMWTYHQLANQLVHRSTDSIHWVFKRTNSVTRKFKIKIDTHIFIVIHYHLCQSKFLNNEALERMTMLQQQSVFVIKYLDLGWNM